MRRISVLLAATAVFLAMTLPAAQAETTARTVTVHIPQLATGAVITIDPTHANVSFGGKFESIQYIGFHVVMEVDLLDPGEGFHIDGNKLGGRWAGAVPVSEFTFSPHPETYHYWLDGHERIEPVMVNKLWDHDDSVRVVEFTATIVGER